MAPCTWRTVFAASTAASRRGHLRVRDVDGARGAVVRHRERGAIDDRPGELDAHRDIGEQVFHRLERADRLAELLALGGVAHGHVEHLLADAEQLCGACQRGTVERGVKQAPGFLSLRHTRLGARRPIDAKQSPRGIVARLVLQRDALARHGVQLVAARQQQQIGDVRVGDERVDLDAPP